MTNYILGDQGSQKQIWLGLLAKVSYLKSLYSRILMSAKYIVVRVEISQLLYYFIRFNVSSVDL